MHRILVDSSVLSSYLKARRHRKENAIAKRIDLYLKENQTLEFSVLSRYEIERGLRHLGASVQLDALDRLCRHSIVHEIDERIAIKASSMWASLTKKGRRPSDVDVLIAATASVKGCTVAFVDRDFKNFQEFVPIEDWLPPL